MSKTHRASSRPRPGDTGDTGRRSPVSGNDAPPGEAPASAPPPSDHDARAFGDQLWDCLADDDPGALDRLAGCVRDHPDRCLTELLAVFDSDRWQYKRRVADLFKAALADRAPTILVPMLNGPSDDRHFWAATILGELKSAEAVPALVASITQGPRTRVPVGLKALAAIDHASARTALLDYLLTGTDWSLLSAAMRTMLPLAGSLADELIRRFPILDRTRQAWVLKYLAEAALPQGLAVFKEALQRHRQELGLFAVAGLGRIGSAEAVAELARLLDTEREWFVRKRIVQALGLARDGTAIPPLLRALADPSPQVRATAREAISKVGSLDVPATLADIGAMNAQARIGLIQALGGVRHPSVLAVLTRALEDRQLLFFALEALGELGMPEAGGALGVYLRDRDWFIRLNALEALGKLAVPNLATLAERCLDDENEMVRRTANRLVHRAQAPGAGQHEAGGSPAGPASRG